MAKRIYLSDVPGISAVDTRSDVTRRGYHEGYIPYGAGNTQVGQFPLKAMYDAFDDYGNPMAPNSPNYNPNIQIIAGNAPIPGTIKRIPREWINAANDFVKTNKLSTFTSPNGKTYVKLLNGNVRSIESLGKEEWGKTVRGTVEYLKNREINGPIDNIPHYTRDPATNINATSGPIIKVKGKLSNRGKIGIDNFYNQR